MSFIDNKYVKTITPAMIAIVVGLCGNALFSLEKNSGKFYFVLGIFIIAVLVDIALIVYNISKEEQINELICESDEEIKSAMKKIIKMQGKVCIMSRDLSWVDAEVEACISFKSASMLIFAEKETELTERLKKCGVDLRYYGALGFEPKTRFTIIRYNANNPQVAIANTRNLIRKKGKFKHTIYQTTNESRIDEWINSLAVDMVTLCKLVCDGE